jgi:hypothetical protein
MVVDLWGRFGGGLESFEVLSRPPQSRVSKEFRSSPQQSLAGPASHARGHRFESCSAHYFNASVTHATVKASKIWLLDRFSRVGRLIPLACNEIATLARGFESLERRVHALPDDFQVPALSG